MADDDGKWHLDKKVPIGLMMGLALNAMLGIWYASKLDSRVAYLESDGVKTAVAVENLRASIEGPAGLQSQVIESKANTKSVLDIVQRLDRNAMQDPHAH